MDKTEITKIAIKHKEVRRKMAIDRMVEIAIRILEAKRRGNNV